MNRREKTHKSQEIEACEDFVYKQVARKDSFARHSPKDVDSRAELNTKDSEESPPEQLNGLEGAQRDEDEDGEYDPGLIPGEK